MRRVESSISIASPNVLVRKTILLPSGDQSARSPNHVSCVMCGGRCSAGFSPARGSAEVDSGTTAVASAKLGKKIFQFMDEPPGILNDQRRPPASLRQARAATPSLHQSSNRPDRADKPFLRS